MKTRELARLMTASIETKLASSIELNAKYKKTIGKSTKKLAKKLTKLMDIHQPKGNTLTPLSKGSMTK